MVVDNDSKFKAKKSSKKNVVSKIINFSCICCVQYLYQDDIRNLLSYFGIFVFYNFKYFRTNLPLYPAPHLVSETYNMPEMQALLPHRLRYDQIQLFQIC